MQKMLDWRTVKTMLSAFLVAGFFCLPEIRQHIFGYIGYRLIYFGDALFHEMGHAVFFWLFGRPALPSIMTAVGPPGAGGITIPFFHSVIVQVISIAVLCYGCFMLYRTRPMLSYPAMLFTLFITVAAFTRYPLVICTYMGHGSAILCAGVLLYRAWLDIIVKTEMERWFNALFGFFILFNNADLCRMLLTSPALREEYAQGGHDFYLIMLRIPQWSIEGIALFTLIYCGLTLIGSFLLAGYFYEDEHYDTNHY